MDGSVIMEMRDRTYAEPPAQGSRLEPGANSSLERRYSYIIQQLSSGGVVRPTYEDFTKWTMKLVGNHNLSSTHVRVMIALWEETNRRQRQKAPDGLVPIYEPVLAEKAGVSPCTVSRSIHLLARSNIIHKRIEWDGERKHLFLALSQQAIERPEMLTLKEARNHGGLRCKHCGGEMIPTQWTCTSCGAVTKKGKK